MHPLRALIEDVGQRLTSDAMAERVMGQWDTPGSRPVFSIAPPLARDEIAGVERLLGQELPSSLLEFLTEVTSDFKLSWGLQANMVPNSYGGRSPEYAVTLPDGLMEWSHAPLSDGTYPDGAKQYPIISSGRAALSIENLLATARGLAGWLEIYDPAQASTEDERSHLEIISNFMASGLPILTAPNGDWLAIDQSDDAECLHHVSHEGGEAGIEIDLDLIGFLTHQMLLGPVWPDFLEIYKFSDNVRDVVEGDYRIQSADFSAFGVKGEAWRDWFWGGDPPVAAPELLDRCGPLPIS